MKIKDFENAIDNLRKDIIIDEIKIHHSQVRQANGHNDKHSIVWDEEGKAFTPSQKSETYFVREEGDVLKTVTGFPLIRNNAFDLNFE